MAMPAQKASAGPEAQRYQMSNKLLLDTIRIFSEEGGCTVVAGPAGLGVVTANGVAWTVNSSGISLNVPAFLTTAAQSNHSHNFATTTTNGSLIACS